MDHAWWLGVLFVLACYQALFMISAVYGDKKWEVVYTWNDSAIEGSYQTKSEYPTLDACREAVITVKSNVTSLMKAEAYSNDGEYVQLYP
jgi:hypothetical protein